MPKKILIPCILLLCLSTVCSAQLPSNIRICSPQWDYYTEKDGTGLYHELWAAVFTPSNIRVDIDYIPFKRCEREFTDHKITRYDAYVGGYGAAGQLIPKWHIGIDALSVAYRNGFITEWLGEVSLTGNRVSWERGYDYDKHGVINVDIQLKEFSKLTSALKMLHRNRIDYILDYDTALKGLIKELGLSGQLTVISNAIIGPKYFMIFSNTERGQALAEVWDSGMERLYKSGQLKKLYAAYNDHAY